MTYTCGTYAVILFAMETSGRADVPACFGAIRLTAESEGYAGISDKVQAMLEHLFTCSLQAHLTASL